MLIRRTLIVLGCTMSSELRIELQAGRGVGVRILAALLCGHHPSAAARPGSEGLVALRGGGSSALCSHCPTGAYPMHLATFDHECILAEPLRYTSGYYQWLLPVVNCHVY